jgi:xanthine dehydrogenase large subunit
MLQERPIRGGVSAALAHDSAAQHVSGEAIYVDDIPELPDTLHLYVAISTRPHARIVALDVSRVRQQPGVVCVLTAADIPGVNDASPIFGDDPVFAVDEVQYAGQSIFAVAAETIESARAAAKLARIEYNDLPALITIDDALAANADLLPPQTMRLGDVDAALRKRHTAFLATCVPVDRIIFILRVRSPMRSPARTKICWSIPRPSTRARSSTMSQRCSRYLTMQ